MGLLAMWILYAAFGVTLFALLFLWAVRSGQFRDQDRARYLPLQDEKSAAAAPACQAPAGEEESCKR
jgi:cbb3-type cytochrome oxidase maturation protein